MILDEDKAFHLFYYAIPGITPSNVNLLYNSKKHGEKSKDLWNSV